MCGVCVDYQSDLNVVKIAIINSTLMSFCFHSESYWKGWYW